MKQTKKFISLLLCMAMSVSLIAIPAYAGGTGYTELPYGDSSLANGTTMPTTATDTAKYTFGMGDLNASGNADGQKYLMLEKITVDGKDQYAILQTTKAGFRSAITTDSANPKLNPDADGTVMYFLNHEYAQKYDTIPALKTAAAGYIGSGKIIDNSNYIYRKLNNNFVDYLQTHTWQVAASTNAASAPEGVKTAYTFEAKIAMPSWSELKVKYADRIGASLFDSNSGMMLRNHVYDSGNKVLAVRGGGTFNVQGVTTNSGAYIYPMFYVSEDFFKNVRIPQGDYGIEIAKIIAGENTYDELVALKYTDAEIEAMGVTPPSVTPPDTDADTDAYKELTYGDSSVADGTTMQSTAADTAKYTFGMGDLNASGNADSQKYLMLEKITVDGKDQYAILQTTKAGFRSAITTDSANPKLNPDAAGTVMYFLNHEYAQKYDTIPALKTAAAGYIGSGKIIDNSNYIYRKLNNNFADYLQTHTWQVAASTNAASAPEGVKTAYTFDAKIAMPSWSELKVKYADRIGASLFDSNSGMILRNHVYDSGNKVLAVRGGGTFNVQGVTTNSGAYIYPMFYVSEDFFKNVRIPQDDYGTEIAKIIAEENDGDYYKLIEIGYTAEEVEAMGIEYPGAPPEASNVVIKADGLYPGYGISVVYDYYHSEGVAEGTSAIKWYVSDSKNGAYTLSNAVSGNNVFIPNQWTGKYVKAGVTAITAEGKAAEAEVKSDEAILIGSTLSRQPSATNEPMLPEATMDGDDEYAFYVNGAKFYLLDSEINNGKIEFYVYKQGKLGNLKYDARATNSLKFNPDDEGTAAYWLNHNFDDPLELVCTDGSYSSLGSWNDKKILSYVNYEHIWRTEANGVSIQNDYTFKAGLTFMSYNEFAKYHNKVGLKNLQTIFRTSLYNNDELYLSISTAGAYTTNKVNGTMSGRIVFYMFDDFFKNVRPDSMGNKVKEMIVKSIPMEDMLSGDAKYTKEELISMGYTVTAEQAEDVLISGGISIGEALNAEYSYSGSEGDTSKTLYQWYRLDSKDDTTPTAIEGSNLKEYIPTAEDEGKYLAVKITPYDASGYYGNSDMVVTGCPVRAEQDVKTSLKDFDINGSSTELTFTINNQRDAHNVTIIATGYNSDNQMISIDKSVVMVNPGKNDYNLTVTNYNSSAYKYLLMIWDSENTTSGMKPIIIEEIILP